MKSLVVGFALAALPVSTGRSDRLPELVPSQVGKAAWYGDDFHGLPTASGEVFDMHELTAAHRDLPLGSLVQVTHLRTGRSIVVRVNDRGPWGDPDRIIDLSYGASRRLGMVYEGVARVRLRPLSD